LCRTVCLISLAEPVQMGASWDAQMAVGSGVNACNGCPAVAFAGRAGVGQLSHLKENFDV